MEEEKIDIVYIAGAGRSGSTMLGDVLGLLPGVYHLGELRGIFDYTILPDKIMPCSCGQDYQDCEYWNPIFNQLFGAEWTKVFADLRIEGDIPRSVSLPLLELRKRAWRARQAPIKDAIRQVLAVLVHLKKTTSTTLFVDTSKAAPFAWLLAQDPRVRIVILHLIRDPRATVYSWINRPIPLYDQDRRSAAYGTLSKTQATIDWIKANSAAWMLKFMGFPYYRVQYEDFVQRPDYWTGKLAGFIARHGMEVPTGGISLEELTSRDAAAEVRHLIGSNPGVKQRKGVLTIREDTSWLGQLSIANRIILTIFLLPWLLGFNFRLWPMSKASSPP